MFNIITSAFTDRLITALCNTLVYSLLQGVVLAAVAGLIVIFTRKASAAGRYNLLVGVLVLFALSTAVTFTIQFGHAQSNDVLQTTTQTIVKHEVTVQPVIYPDPQNGVVNYTAVLVNYLNAYHNTIVLIWFLIICAKSIQLGTGLQGIYRLKRKNVLAVPADWEAKMRFMAYKLGIKQKIALLESGLAKVPMVIGHLKPVILIPVGLLTALSTTEVEAILMHELAHIRRRDYLVNLLQSLVEIIFFFNPAVLWVSQLIKTEREHCCDDMALAQNTSKSGYIRALVSCQEYQATPAYAMAFPGQKNHLVDRVKRLVNNRNHSLDVFEKTLLTICLVMAGLCLSAYAEKDNIKRAAHAVVTAMKPREINKEEQLQPVQQTAALVTEIKQLYRPHAELLTKNQPGLICDVDTIKVPQQLNPIPPNPQIRVDARIDMNVNAQVSTNVNTNALGKLNARLDTINTRVRVNQTRLQPKAKVRIDSMNKQVPIKANLAKLQAMVYQDSVKQYRKSAKLYTAQPYQPKTIVYKPYVAIRDDERRDDAINEMLKDGLIKSRDNLSFKISNKELIINYQKQPEEIFQKYKARYVKNTNGEWSWMYNYDSDKHTESNTIIDKSKN